MYKIFNILAYQFQVNFYLHSYLKLFGKISANKSKANEMRTADAESVQVSYLVCFVYQKINFHQLLLENINMFCFFLMLILDICHADIVNKL